MHTALFIALLACQGEDPADTDTGVDPLLWPADADGPFGIGYQLTEASYTTALGSARTIPVLVWYPTEAQSGGEVRYAGLFPDERALGDALAAPPVFEGRYPVLVHSHGNWGVAGGVSYLAHRLVSHGWVVIAPEHLGDTFSEGFPDFDGASPTAHYIERPQDVSAALDHVRDAGLLAGPIQAETVGLSGHSRGVYTTWAAGGGTFDPALVAAACAGEGGAFPSGTCTAQEQAVFLSGALGDPRFTLTIPMAGTIRRELMGDTGHRSAYGPVLSLTGTADSPDGQGQYDSMDQIAFSWVEVEGACHESFNLGVEVPSLAPCPTIDRDIAWDLTATYAHAFLRHHLLGDTSAAVEAILTEPGAVDPAARLWVKTP